MTQTNGSHTRWATAFGVAIAALALTGGLAAAQERVNTHAAALSDFTARLEKYLALRADLAGNMTPLSSTTNAGDLSARRKGLTKALQNARNEARHGDLMSPDVAEYIRATIKTDMAGRQPSAKRAALEEVPRAPRLTINGSYPEEAALATVPPKLLANLPRLPDNLQYRFYGRHLVLIDGDVEIILDYVADALPAH